MNRDFPLLKNPQDEVSRLRRRSVSCRANNHISRIARKRNFVVIRGKKKRERGREREFLFAPAVCFKNYIAGTWSGTRETTRELAIGRVINLWNIVSRESVRARAGSGGYRQFTLLIAKVRAASWPRPRSSSSRRRSWNVVQSAHTRSRGRAVSASYRCITVSYSAVH